MFRNLRPDVYNENQVRAAAGVTMAAGTIAFCYAYFEQRFLPIKAVSAFFFLDFLIRVTVGLRFSPTGLLSKQLVRNRPPDLVSSAPKRFAWTLGLTMSGATAIITNVDIHGMLPRTLCLICIALMWMEAVLGLCLGCEMYAFGLRRGWVQRKEGMVCAGGVCEVPQPALRPADVPTVAPAPAPAPAPMPAEPVARRRTRPIEVARTA